MVLAAWWWSGVTTKVLGRDRGFSMGKAEAGRDIDLRSRPGLLKLVSHPHFFEVATWAVLVRQQGGRDMGLTSRPGLVVQEVAT